jgi:hypothetical protein
MVGESAKVLATISADEVQIGGVVEGNVVARRKITLQRTAVVQGDLTTPGIVIEDGAKLKGRIVIGSDAEPTSDAAVEPKPAKAAKKTQPVQKPQTAGAKFEESPSSPYHFCVRPWRGRSPGARAAPQFHGARPCSTPNAPGATARRAPSEKCTVRLRSRALYAT